MSAFTLSAADVTTIIAVRNAAHHLAAAIASVVGQRPSPADVIVIDGGSVDGSPDVCAGVPGVRLVAQRTKGLAAARNEAIALATTGWVAFCDADDTWTPGSLACRMRAVDAGAVAVVGMLVREAIPGVEVAPAQRPLLGQRRPGLTPGALLVRRDLFATIGGFDESLAIGADSEWFSRLAQSDQLVKTVPDVVLRKGARSASLSCDIAAYRKELLLIARRCVERHEKPR
jgi:glycosyltransferase involved in cell wall biosynthesis